MPIKRSFEQTKYTLEEFYSEREMAGDYTSVGEHMLAFLRTINELFPTTQLFGLTSHYRLVIRSEDTLGSEWLIIVSAVAGWYYFEFLVPKEKAPWENAFVRGEAKSLDDAKKYLLIAMRECEGWKTNDELKQRLAEYNV